MGRRYIVKRMPDYQPNNRHHKGEFGVWDKNRKEWVVNATYTIKSRAMRLMISLNGKGN